MKRCKFEQAAHLYPLGALTQSEKARFEAHMATCAGCARIAKEAGSISSMYKATGADAPSAGFEQRILNSIKARTETQPAGFDWTPFFRLNKAMLPVAACLTIFLFIAVLFVSPTGAQKSVALTTTAAVTQQKMTPSGYYIKETFGENEGNLISGDRNTAVKSYYKILSGKYKTAAKGAR
jgi:hypothetical protein